MPEGTSELPAILEDWTNAAVGLVEATPLHLLSEREFRRALALNLLGLDQERFAEPEHLQFEKTGNGVPPRRPIDLYFETDSERCFVEFKYWHTMVKVSDGRRQIGQGNNTPNDVEEWLNDFDKLLRIDNRGARRWFLLVAQLTQYEGSRSRLPFDLLELRHPHLSPRRLAKAGASAIELPNGLPGTTHPLFEAVIARSPEGVQFGIYGLELRRLGD